LKHFEASPLLCVVKGILLNIGRNLLHSLAVADTGKFGRGDAISICNEPNASQDHIA